MLACSKIPRATTLPLIRITSTKYILAKYFSGKSNDNDEEYKNAANEFCSLCACCSSCPCGTTPKLSCYDARKYGHCLPHCTRCPEFETVRNIPTDVFRCTTGERLGPQGQASKCCAYLNPEYYSYHHMSYYDLHYALRPCRIPCPPTGRKPV